MNNIQKIISNQFKFGLLIVILLISASCSDDRCFDLDLPNFEAQVDSLNTDNFSVYELACLRFYELEYLIFQVKKYKNIGLYPI